MRRRGIIIEKTAGELVVRIQDPARTCGSCKGCMRLTPERPPEDYIVRMRNKGDQYDVGEEVIVDGEIGPMIKAVTVLYGVPFVSLFAGYVITRLFTGHDSMAGLGAIAGLLLGAFAARIITRRFFDREPNYQIVARACS
ncbi:MAG: SoxR reducing system RseC family protein [Bacillota bacterium]|jgi:positive regulator of sigma E activity|nr:SoxR reducing system RseC family protein [Bacillota bacterium]HHT89780.1 SoxR reducing system RseC family protein [Bacillota bacterium]